MDIIPFLITLAAGIGIGIFVESRYGQKVAAAHVALEQATQAVHAAADRLKAAIKPTDPPSN